MATASVRLYDPYTLGVAYTGRWVLTLSSFTTDPGSDGNINELDVPVTIYPGGMYDPGFPLYFLFIGNDGTGDPTNFTDGVVIDSDALPAWVTYQAWNYSDNPSTWTTSTSTVQYYDGAWDGLFDLAIPVTVDPLSDPSWLPPVPPLQYEVVVVAQDGTPYGTLTNGHLTRVSWELNGPGAAEISLATTDTDAALMVPGREIQIFYQGGTDPIWWGPIVRPQGGLNESSWQCAGLLWYFTHRFMGRADRVNQLSNGSFESGETGWTFEDGVTHSVNTDMAYVYDGTKSEKLTGTAADHIEHEMQVYTHPAGGFPGGDFITGAVYVYITSGDYVGPALEGLGLLLRHLSGSTVVDVGGSSDSGLPAIINDDTPRDQWVLLKTGVAFVKEGDTVEFLLFPPHGVAYFDLATLTYMESLSFGYPDTPADVVDIIAGIVDYAQDRGAFSHGKSDLNIDPGGTATGELRQVAYQFADHRNIADTILEYVRQGICDINVDITATTRTLYAYPKSDDARTPPFGKGSLYGTTLELDVNVADFTYAQDLEQAASSVVLLGPGDGPDRPEGGATDTSLLAGAFTLEIVEQAPDNTTVGQLDVRAQERLDVAVRPDILDVTTLPGAGIIGNLVVGDTVPVLISNGWVDIDATYRVARIEADLLKDQATITLNAIPT